MVKVDKDLWGSVLQAHRAAIVSSLDQDLAHALRRVDDLRDALKGLAR
jgi:hypothetical protein